MCIWLVHLVVVEVGYYHTRYTQMKDKKYTITKRIAKHGDQAIIVIPSVLKAKLSPGTIVELTFKILKENKTDDSDLTIDERGYDLNEKNK